MTQEDIYNASRDRCLENPSFIPAFYRLLFSSSPQMEKLFQITDMKKQQEMLKTALIELASFENFTPDKLEYWLDLSRHHHEIDIKHEHYEIWKKCMLQNVCEHDPKYNLEIENAWGEKLDQIISVMTLVY